MNELLQAFLIVGVLSLPMLPLVRLLRARLTVTSALEFQRYLFVVLASLPFLAPWLADVHWLNVIPSDLPLNSPLPLQVELALDAVSGSDVDGNVMPISQGLFASWLLVAAILLSAILMEQFRFRRIAARSDTLDRSRLPVPVPSGTRVAMSNGKSPAFVVGLLKPTIVLPASMLDDEGELSTNSTLAAVLLHELAHVENRDTGWLLACRSLLCLSWPMVPLWILYRSISLQAELAADAHALRGTDSVVRRQYAANVIAAMQGGPVPVGLPTFTSRNLRRARMRIRNILEHRNETTTPTFRRLAGFSAFLLAVPLVGIQTAIAKADIAFIAPVSQGELTSEYGLRHNPFTGTKAHHNGIDIKAPLGTPILSPAGGKVVFAGEKNDRYGIVVEIMHLGGFRSLYAHLESTDLEVGDVIAEGATLGRVGVTGQTTGPHVHVELYQDGKRVDPQGYLPVRASDR